MSPKASSAEAFLLAFHDARPGLTSKAFGSLPVFYRGQQSASSYEILASVIPSSAKAVAVLDLACGDGHLLALLASRAQPELALSGIDMSPSELEVARSRVGERAGLCHAMAQQVPFSSGSFDYVLCHMALMLMEDIERVLGEVRRVLRPGARFAAVLGATQPPSHALTAYIESISKRSRLPQFSQVRFGDRRLRDREGIGEVFATEFHEILVEDIQIPQRLTPAQLWHWFLGMYDLYLLSTDDQRLVERDFMSAVAADCGSDGSLDFPQTLRFVCATAA